MQISTSQKQCMSYMIKDSTGGTRKGPKSPYEVVGSCRYDDKLVDFSRELGPPLQAELETTGVNREYLYRGELHVKLLGRGAA